MHKWSCRWQWFLCQNFIATQAVSGPRSLRDFAATLRNSLESGMSLSVKDSGSLVHIAGYVEENGLNHPEFYFVRNAHGIDSGTGEYLDIRQQFLMSEDFWSRDCPARNLMAAFQTRAYQIYINGFASGRIGYLAVQERLNSFFRMIWTQPNWRFRPPNSLAESVLFVQLYMSIINTLFQVSDYAAPFVGGGTQIHSIAQPDHTVTTC